VRTINPRPRWLAACIPLATLLAGWHPALGQTATLSLVIQSRRALTHDGSARTLAWQPQGALLLYTDPVLPRPGSLWATSLGGWKRWKVNSDPVDDAAFTPDGRHVVYELAAGPHRGSIVQANLHGNHRRILLENGAGSRRFRPVSTTGGSPLPARYAQSLLTDGRMAVVRNRHLYALDLSDGILTRLGSLRLPEATSPAAQIGLSLAPNARWLAVSYPTNPRLVVYDVRTGRPIPRLRVAAGIEELAWSPNSRTLAYKVDGPGGSLFALDTETGAKYLLKRVFLELILDMAWSPDSRTLVFSDAPADSAVGPLARMEAVTVDGTGLHILDRSSSAQPGESGLLWSPHGNVIAYTRLHGRPDAAHPWYQSDVWIATLSGTDASCDRAQPERRASPTARATSPERPGRSADNVGSTC
jgi:dipeptidyl aminopeptidase/acylaminoacyl peptidase